MIKLILLKTCKAIRLFLERISNLLPVPKDRVRVHHGADSWGIGGPAVKIQRMQEYFPDYPVHYNIIYTVSASVSSPICNKAKQRGVKIVQHINSVHSPTYRSNYDELNRPFKEIYNNADHVVFGSRHAKIGAERFLGKCKIPYSIIYNSIDMSHFKPQERPENRCNIMAIGNHYIRHRIEPLIRAMPFILKRIPNARLVIAGPLRKGKGVFDCSKKSIEALARELNVKNIEYYSEFTQKNAPSIYALGDVMVHIKHMDWTPNTVIESMACGLPVLHSGNGGLPEIVGDAGLSLNMPYDWNKIHSPESELLAEKIIQLYEKRKEKSEISRERAANRYDLKKWVSKHEKIFETLLNGSLS